MDELFGASMTSIAIVLGALFAIGVAVLVFIAVRNPILFKMAIRNVPRRKTQSILIVVGLMLATMIISSAFTTGDSVSHSIEEIATKDLLNLDQLVQVDDDSEVWENAAVPDDFDEAIFRELEPILLADPDIDAVLPALIENVAVVNFSSGQFEVSALLTGLDPERARDFNRLRTLDGSPVDFTTLAPNELYIDAGGAEELGASTGSTLSVATGPDFFEEFTVKGITDGFFFRPVGTQVSLMLPLARAQELTGKTNPPVVSSIMVSNRGAGDSGVGLTDGIQDRLSELPILRENGLELFPLKTELIDLANQIASIFVTFFTLFGLFSIGVGILLIFLIFSMLAAERKSEMGISRAVGMQRGHLVQMFVAEGAVYSIGAAFVGVLAGVGIGSLLVIGVSEAFSQGAPDDEFTLSPAVSLRSALVSFFAGSVVTFITVGIASWRTSRLNIVRAIRDIPEPEQRRAGVGSLVWGILLSVLGLFLTLIGLSSAQFTPFGLGISILPLGVALVLRYRGVSQRAAWSIVGLFLLVFWLLPPAFFDSLRDDWQRDFSVFFISGFLVVTGAVLLVMNNPQVLMAVSGWLMRRSRRLAPIVKSAVAYPLRNRFRTGLSVAMFGVVVFSIIVMSVLTSSFGRLFDDQDRIAGSYDVVAAIPGEFGPTDLINPVQDPASVVEANLDLTFVSRVDGSPSIGSLRTIFDAEAKLPEEPDEDFEDVFITAIDTDFLDTNGFQIKLATEEFRTSDGFDANAVWRAIRDTPGLAVINAELVPTRDNFQFGDPGDFFSLDAEGLFIENDVMDPVAVTLRDLKSGEDFEVTVIGVVDDIASFFFIPLAIFTSTDTLRQVLPQEPDINSVFFHVDGDPPGAANRIEAAFFQFGLESVDIEEEIDNSQAAQRSFNNLLTGFMGLGLIVGIAALGVISARAVVERRHQIGVLRAIGFSRRMVQFAFLLESSFIAMLGIGLGIALGLITALNITSGIREDEPNLTLVIPWGRFLLVAVVAYLFSWLTTFVPSRNASRVDPADALRYE